MRRGLARCRGEPGLCWGRERGVAVLQLQCTQHNMLSHMPMDKPVALTGAVSHTLTLTKARLHTHTGRYTHTHKHTTHTNATTH